MVAWRVYREEEARPDTRGGNAVHVLIRCSPNSARRDMCLKLSLMLVPRMSLKLGVLLLATRGARAGLTTESFDRASLSYGAEHPLATATSDDGLDTYDPLTAEATPTTNGAGLPLLMPVDDVASQDAEFYSYDPEMKSSSSTTSSSSKPPHVRKRPLPPPSPPPSPPPPDHSRDAHYWTDGSTIRTNVLGGQGGHEGVELKIKGISWFGLESKPCVIGGLDKMPVENGAEFLKREGFNAVRVPLAVSALVSNEPDGGCMPSSLSMMIDDDVATDTSGAGGGGAGGEKASHL